MSRYRYYERTQSHIQYIAGICACWLLLSWCIVTGRVECTYCTYEKLSCRNHIIRSNLLPVTKSRGLSDDAIPLQVQGNVKYTPKFTYFFSSLFTHTSLIPIRLQIKPAGYRIGHHVWNNNVPRHHKESTPQSIMWHLNNCMCWTNKVGTCF